MSEEKMEAEKSVERLIEHLKTIPEAYDIRSHNYAVDFTIGDPQLWPSYTAEDEINSIRSSSISFGGLTPYSNGEAKQGNPQTGSNIHLPPSTSELWNELEEEEKLPDEFILVNGTFALGGLMPPPNGICTPHVLIVEDAKIESVIEAVDEVFRLYEELYDGGDRVIKKKPQADNEA